MQNNTRKSEEKRVMPPTSPEREARLAEARAHEEKLKDREHRIKFKRSAPNHSRKISFTPAPSGAAAIIPPKEMRKKVKKRVKTQKERLARFDFPFFTIVIVLLAFGIVTMFSASYAFAFREHGNSYFFITRQLWFIGGGLAAMMILSRISYRFMLNKYLIRFGAGATLGVMAFVALAGQTQGGAGRWLDIGGTMVQPSEVLKFAVIVVFAYWIHENHHMFGDTTRLIDENGKERGFTRGFKQGFLPMLIFLIVSCVLMLAQPHLSGAIIVFMIGFIMMFIGDCKIRHIILALTVFVAFAAAGISMLEAAGYDYFSSRILSWQNPEADIRGDTFQTYQSLITIGSGGWFGLGLGNSRQKFAYLPASHNDFIFSIICEELGFIGAIVVILLFVLFVARGFYIAVCARDKFGMMLAAGITSQLGVQALLNIGVVTNAVPNTGISLPFFSYGGSALMMQLAGIGVVLNISRKAAIE
ncbi:MAG: putative lipid II flippase FtsW [Oscillospiraceae bacterium]|jgi:cell division protein FtsW|nr:putative lipid II flippase FtsW [Oscillospiraceae bacterium]